MLMWKRFRLLRCTQQNGERANSRWSGFAARLHGFIHSENFEVETGEMAASSYIRRAQNCHQGFSWPALSHGSRHPVYTVGAALASHHISLDTAEKQRQWNVFLMQLQNWNLKVKYFRCLLRQASSNRSAAWRLWCLADQRWLGHPFHRPVVMFSWWNFRSASFQHRQPQRMARNVSWQNLQKNFKIHNVFLFQGRSRCS